MGGRTSQRGAWNLAADLGVGGVGEDRTGAGCPRRQVVPKGSWCFVQGWALEDERSSEEIDLGMARMKLEASGA